MNDTLALIGEDAPTEIYSALQNEGFIPLVLPSDNRLAEPVRSHPDMLLCLIDRYVFCSDKYIKNAPKAEQLLSEYGKVLIKCGCDISSEYPNDIPFNVGIIGKALYGKTDYTAREISEYANLHGYSLINVKQGYAKCSSLVLGNTALISADSGICKMAKSLGIDALQITNSECAIQLNGYGYGFIGGCCGVFNNTVYFSGCIEKHPEFEQINNFCSKHGYSLHSLISSTLQDIGGIIFVESSR